MRFKPSPNHSSRVDLVVLHSTNGAFEGAVEWLCKKGSGVSAHYCVSKAGEVVQMVDESRAAWHGGAGLWKGTAKINTRSIGIEIEHFDDKDELWPEAQIEAVLGLCEAVCRRYTLTADDVVGHKDVAPERKVDPKDFPWQTFRAELARRLTEVKC